MTKRIGLVGARGHTGRELIRLIAGRADLELVFAGSRDLAGRAVTEMAPEAPADLLFEAIDPKALAAREVDAVILALPNGVSPAFVEAIDAAGGQTLLVDLSADWRFDDQWVYGLPEAYGREAIAGVQRVANPGCYATAGQLALAPLRGEIDGSVHVFGVSGYSGAGTTPSRKNDLDALADNLMPYALSGHLHEAEMARHSGCTIRFTPHVAGFFRGIIATVHIPLSVARNREALLAQYREYYAGEDLIEIIEGIPEVRDGADRDGAVIGGFGLSDCGRHVVVVCAIDNLLKGAAVQAMQNLTLALGLPEYGSAR